MYVVDNSCFIYEYATVTLFIMHLYENDFTALYEEHKEHKTLA
jgi:hypothetical protein